MASREQMIDFLRRSDAGESIGRDEMISYLRSTDQQSTPQQDIPKQQRALPMSNADDVRDFDFRGEDEGKLAEFTRGLGLSAVETGLGLKSLFTDLKPEEQRALQLMRQDVEKGGISGDVGRISGELAQLAVPASKLSKLSKAKQLAGGVGLAAGHGALKAPGEDKTRGEEALEAGAFALAGGAAGEALGKAARGIAKSDAAQALLEKGVQLTPGQAAKGGLPRIMEYLLSIKPGSAKAVEALKEESLESFNRVALNEAVPFSDEFLKSGIIKDASKFEAIGEAGEAGFRKLDDMYKDAYDQAWSLAGKPSDDALIGIMDSTKLAKTELPSKYGRQLNAIDDTANLVADGKQPAITLDKAIKKGIDTAWKNGDAAAADTFGDIKNILSESLSGEAKEVLKEVNSNYGKFKAIESAAGRISNEGDLFTPRALKAGSKAAGKSKRFARGESPLRQFAKAGEETLGRKEPLPLMDTIRGVSKQAWSPTGVYRALGKPIMGQTRTQQNMRALANTLRQYGVTPSTIAAATEQ